MRSPDLVNFVSAVAYYYFFLNLPKKFTQPGVRFLRLLMRTYLPRCDYVACFTIVPRLVPPSRIAAFVDGESWWESARSEGIARCFHHLPIMRLKFGLQVATQLQCFESSLLPPLSLPLKEFDWQVLLPKAAANHWKACPYRFYWAFWNFNWHFNLKCCTQTNTYTM